MDLDLILYASTRESESEGVQNEPWKLNNDKEKTLEIFLSTTVQKSGLQKRSHKEKDRYASVSNERLSFRRLKHSDEWFNTIF